MDMYRKRDNPIMRGFLLWVIKGLFIVNYLSLSLWKVLLLGLFFMYCVLNSWMLCISVLFSFNTKFFGINGISVWTKFAIPTMSLKKIPKNTEILLYLPSIANLWQKFNKMSSRKVMQTISNHISLNGRKFKIIEAIQLKICKTGHFRAFLILLHTMLWDCITICSYKILYFVKQHLCTKYESNQTLDINCILL